MLIVNFTIKINFNFIHLSVIKDFVHYQYMFNFLINYFLQAENSHIKEVYKIDLIFHKHFEAKGLDQFYNFKKG